MTKNNKKSREVLLFEAIVEGDLNQCKRYVKSGARLTYSDAYGNSILHQRTSFGNTELFEWALGVSMKASLTLEDKNNYGNTPLALSALHGRLACCMWLLSRGSSIEAINKRNCTMLHLAANSPNDSIELLQFAYDEGVKFGLSFEDVDNHGWTPILHVAQAGKLNLVKWLVEKKGVNVVVKNDDDCNALMIAAGNNRPEVLQYLIELDQIPLNEVNNEGDTPLALALYYKHNKCVALLQAETTRLKEKAGAVEEKKSNDINDINDNKTQSLKTCDGCNMMEREGEKKFLQCPCFKKRYCSSRCQLACRKKHKVDCNRWIERSKTLRWWRWRQKKEEKKKKRSK